LPMKKVLVIYWSHDGRTARIARCICRVIAEAGHSATMMQVAEAAGEGVDFKQYDLAILGCGLRYGEFSREFRDFVNENKAVLDAMPNSMFNVTAIARNPIKATVAGNVYARKFMENNPWKPKEMVCFGGKVDYPRCGPIDRFCIWLIMSITQGPRDTHARHEFTRWDEVEAYARHCVELLEAA